MNRIQAESLFNLMFQILSDKQIAFLNVNNVNLLEYSVWMQPGLLFHINFKVQEDGTFKFNCCVKSINETEAILAYTGIKSIDIAKTAFEKSYFYCEEY